MGILGRQWNGNQRATRTSGSGLVGEYAATGKNPDGKEYTATLTIEPAVSRYRFVWSNNTEGLGIKRGENIAVGIGGSRCGFVTYEIQSDGTLNKESGAAMALRRPELKRRQSSRAITDEH